MPTDPLLEVVFIPLGAGGHCVRANGWVFEAVSALVQRRSRCRLYHSALHAHLDRCCYLIEMAPVWSGPPGDHGARVTGPVGLRALGRFAAFRYEVRCRPGGVVPDLDEAVDPQPLATDPERLTRLLALTAEFPSRTWGRDEQQAGEMWNSNSLVSWLLVRSGHDEAAVVLPVGGRAPGWDAGRVVALRDAGRRTVGSRVGRAGETS